MSTDEKNNAPKGMKWSEIKPVIKETEWTEEELAARKSEAYYQATQDWQRGGANPEDAFHARGFCKNKNGRWVFDR